MWIVSEALALLNVIEGSAGAYGLVALLIVLSTVTVGAILVTRLPGHIVGRLLLLGGLSFAISVGAAAIADYGLNAHPGTVPGATWFAVIGAAAGSAFIAPLVGFVPLFFPTGHLPSPRWRVAAALGLVPTVSSPITGALAPFSANTYPAGVENPIALGGPGGQLVALLSAASTVCGLLALVLVTASLVVRYRRARGVERQQIRWFAACGSIVVPAFVIASLTSEFTTGPLAVVANLAWSVALIGMALLPVAIGIAILRYRLYEIDRLISRTIAYAVVSLVLASVFAGVVLTVQAVLGPLTGSNTIAVAGSTLLVASLFQPIRRRVQRLVDRRFNRTRYDAEGTVAAFADRLRDQVDLTALRSEILTTVNAAVEPNSVSLWLRE